MKNSIVIISCLVAVAFVATGCGQKAKEKLAEGLVENVLEKHLGKNASVDISGDNVSIQTAEGSLKATDGNLQISTKEGDMHLATGAEAKKVTFPDELYSYPGAEVTLATVSPKGYHFGLETKDNPKKVFKTFKAEMEKKGWQTKMATENEGNAMLILEKDTKVVQTVVSPNDKTTAIMITFGDKK